MNNLRNDEAEDNVKILFIEDFEGDYELAKHAISREGMKFESFRVENSKDLVKALHEFNPNIIISDYNLPQLDGLKALKIVQTEKPNIPFIILTGSLNEEIAVGCIKAGASDYIIKDRIKRLPFALKEALNQYRIKIEKERSDIKIKENEQKYRNLFDFNPYPMWIYDINSLKILEVNNSATVQYGYSKEEFLDLTITDIIRPEAEIEMLKESIQKAKNELRSSSDWRHITKSGEVIFVEVTSYSILYNGIEARHVIINNITEKRKFEIALKQSEDNFHRSLNESPLGIRIVSKSGETLYINKALLEIFGFSSIDDYKNTSTDKLYSKESYNQHVERKKRRKIVDSQQEGYQIDIIRNDGLIRNVQVIRKPVIWNNEKQFQVIYQDITEQKQIEKELILAKEKAEESDRLKTAFLQNMSHEIRTPMNAIVGFSELMEYELDNPEKIKEYLSTIKLRSSDLLDIINELLDIARIESGQLKLYDEKVDLEKLIEVIFKEFSKHHLKNEKPNVALSYSKIPNHINSQVLADSGKIKQVFNNLIHNALKFTNEGSVMFGYHSIDDSSITFHVTDTGQGIPDNMKGIIFDRFRKSADETAYVQDGIGLGLSIVRGLIKLMNGDIWFESEVNKGTTFFFKIPYTPSISKESPDVRRNDTYDWSSYSILIVEDDQFNISLFEEMLKPTKINCFFANTGLSAIELFKSINNKVDLILMDIKLPDISGFEVTMEFKKINPKLPILAQTAFASENDKKKALDSGCSGFVAKPIKRDLLFETINQFLL